MEEEEDGLERFMSSITNIRIISCTVEARRTG